MAEFSLYAQRFAGKAFQMSLPTSKAIFPMSDRGDRGRPADKGTSIYLNDRSGWTVVMNDPQFSE